MALRGLFDLCRGKGDLRGLASGPVSLELLAARFRLVCEVLGAPGVEIGSGAAFRLLLVADVEVFFVGDLLLVFLAAGVVPSDDDRSASAALALARVTRLSELSEAEAWDLDLVVFAEELFVVALGFFPLGSGASGGGEVDLLLVLSEPGG